MRLRLFVLICFFVSVLSFSRAQNATSSLRGAVADATGAVVPGATVEITDAAIGFHASATTNSRGEYSFQQLTPGDYTILITANGFGQTRLKATLLVAQPATANATVSVQAANTTVEVTSQAQLLNTTDATIGNAVDNEQIMQLPSEGRNPQTLLGLQPGVLFLGQSDSGESRNGVVSGARADQTNITLDGLDNNDQIFPSAFTGVLRTTLDSTEEFRVTTSNANADTGRSSGGQVNLVTRSGTNMVHGAVYEYNRNTFGSANDWFAKQQQLASGLPNRAGKIILNTYGARLGGPIKRDKMFLFGNYEGNRQNEATAVTRTVPTPGLMAGNISYRDASGGVTTLSPAQIATMDPNCSANGTCPWGPGVDPNSLAVFKLYPKIAATNGTYVGGDGLNTGSYVFNSPVPVIQNVYISRFDFNPSDKHRFYVRGSVQNDSNSGAQFLPGQPASTTNTDDSKGISANYTWSLSSTKVNNLRYGFTRQSYATRGAGNGSYVSFRGIDLPESNARSTSTVLPLHNIIDDFTWTKGRHTVQFGANYRHFTYQNSTDANAYNSAITNASWLKGSHLANTGGSFDPGEFGFTPVDGNFRTSYDYAMTALAGLLPEETDNYNYKLSSDGTTGNLQSTGAAVQRSYRANEVEYYVQDTFKPVSNLTITAGIRHTIMQTPYETNGQQVQPTINIHDWFKSRAAGAALGQSVQPEIQFAPSGQERGSKPYYPINWKNIAPRFALAYSPAPEEGTLLNKLFGGAGHSSIRAGFGVYFDHFGEGLVVNYSRHGSFSLGTSLTNPASSLTPDTTPRFTGLHNLPGLVTGAQTKITYPQTPPDDPNTTGFAITQGLDDHIQTPYSEVFNLSFQRQLRGGFTLETDYVGRVGRHLLQSMDLAQPLDLVDPKSGMDYYAAATMFSKASDAHATTISPIPYWENMFPEAASPGISATQEIYNDEFGPGYNQRGNETELIADLDIYCEYGCPGNHYGRYWPLQYSSLYAISSNGTSSYNSAQVILRHPMKHDVQFDLSYTLSKSLDLGSDSETNAPGTGNEYGFIIDGFNPRKNYAVSDFDTRHLFTADWVLNLPAGRGHRFGGNSGRLMDALIGGWNTSGIYRLSSGLPWTIYSGSGWVTNWEYESAVIQTGPVQYRKHIDSAGAPQIFDDPLKELANTRDPYPGEAGERNFFRGDGFFNVDAGLHKMVHVNDRVFFHFAWEVFNVTNSARFDVHSAHAESTDSTQLGTYSGLLGSGAFGAPPARRMQLSGRIEF